MARALIAGCGYVGAALGERLAGAGHEVWGLRRSPGDLPPGVAPLAADLGDPGSLRDLPARLDWVFYTAAPDERTDEAYRAVYVDGLRNLLEALADQAQSPGRVLFTSSTGVYAQTDGEWVDETSPTDPASFSGRLLLEAERTLLAGPYPGVVVRLGGIYGPGRTRLVREVRAGTATCPPGPPRYSNRVHRDDCVGLLHHLVELERPESLYLGVDWEPAPLCDVFRWLARRLDLPAPPVGEVDSAERRSNKRCSSARLVATGYRFRYPTYREGFERELSTA